MNDLREQLEPTDEAAIPWPLAATPMERLEAGAPTAQRADVAASRYAFWRELGWVKAHPERAAARFASLGLSEPRFVALFGEDPGALAARLGPAPAWFHRASIALAEHAGAREGDGPGSDMDLLSLVSPLIDHATRELSSRLAQLLSGAGVPEELAPLASLAEAPPGARLWEALNKTILLEMKVAQLDGLLRSKTAEERLVEFAARAFDPKVRAPIWAEYPVLVRYVVTLLNQWVDRSVEVAQRLIADWHLLIASGLLPKEPGRLLELSMGQGDVHRDGQSVAIAVFENAKVVYKPRSLGAEDALHRLLTWFNRRRPAYELRALRIVDRGDYGWTEFLAHEPCTDPEQLPAFYWRAGALLALLHASWGIDFHRENLIAHGAHPVAIDCETLCHLLDPDVSGVSPEPGPEPVGAFLARGVHRVGLLPVPVMFRDEQSKWRRTDLSALAGAAGQRDPVTCAMPVVENGEYRIRPQRGHIEAAHNLPSDISPAAFIRDVVDGFAASYRALLDGRDELLGEGAWIDGLRGIELRLLVRPSMYYERVLADSFHPDFLRDAMDRSVCLDRLFAHGHRPGMAPVIEDEIRQLETGNIPLFTFRPESRDLILSRGDRVRDFLPAIPLDCVRERLQGLSELDLAHQIDSIELTLACFDPPKVDQPEPAPIRMSRAVTAGELRAEAKRIGAMVKGKRIEGEGGVGWQGAKNFGHGVWSSGALGSELYDGLGGIALFLAVLGRETSDGAALRIAIRIGDQMAEGLRPLADDPDAFAAIDPEHTELPIGAFTGLGGALYVLGNLTHLTGDTRWIPCLRGLASWLGKRCATDPHLDVIAGTAGALLGLLSIDDLVDVRAAAAMAARRLLETQAIRGRHAGGWCSPSGSRPLAGMGHGAAGMAMALSRWNALSPDPRVPRALASALSFEARLFDRDAGTWRDARESEQTFMTGWCHGAPGIAASRLAMLRAWPDAKVQRDLRRGIRATIVHGGFASRDLYGAGHDGLCHGDLGNLELLCLASREPSCESLAPTKIAQCYRAVLKRAARDGWRACEPLGIPSPGLMNGLSGIGLALLRAATWIESEGAARSPSVLLLERFSS
ncbi:type 2 lanthipeptide synthetase LanM family protein [Pendulispora albinea]|uniref:Type 2 lantipeptide synthetase LanM family protein n=1 Tax=Pendulispora albinea TaxID=2741071 RepID=A0ABZ2MBA9_9BACT